MRGEMVYKVIMIDSSPGHMGKKGRSHQKEAEERGGQMLGDRRVSWSGLPPWEPDSCLLSVAVYTFPMQTRALGGPATLRFQATNQQLAKGLEFRFLCPGN